MLVERTFEMLKTRFRILLKKKKIPLHHMPNFIMTCICLHNMCVVNLDGFDMDWALEVHKDAQTEANTPFGNLKVVEFFGWLTK
jgi:hypothetical protein